MPGNAMRSSVVFAVSTITLQRTRWRKRRDYESCAGAQLIMGLQSKRPAIFCTTLCVLRARSAHLRRKGSLKPPRGFSIWIFQSPFLACAEGPDAVDESQVSARLALFPHDANSVRYPRQGADFAELAAQLRPGISRVGAQVDVAVQAVGDDYVGIGHVSPEPIDDRVWLDRQLACLPAGAAILRALDCAALARDEIAVADEDGVRIAG